MPWQKIVRHISNNRIIVKSRSGNEYPVEVEYEHTGRAIYKQLINQAHDSKEYWAWIEFENDSPILKDFVRGEMPDSPPWE